MKHGRDVRGRAASATWQRLSEAVEERNLTQGRDFGALLDWVEGPDPRGRGFQGMGSTSRDRVVPGRQVSQGKRLLMRPTSRRGVAQGRGMHGSCSSFK
ncbi:hypothetical protein [Thermosporothrix hazakensis]|uniref:hypothetical protein n=1 Tax=Thermosporothrix hazakensis TaxID=644383 RepID=UPI001B864D94|nr:hypothetical protein [Thermosporothrix hazakensis]